MVALIALVVVFCMYYFVNTTFHCIGYGHLFITFSGRRNPVNFSCTSTPLIGESRRARLLHCGGCRCMWLAVAMTAGHVRLRARLPEQGRLCVNTQIPSL